MDLLELAAAPAQVSASLTSEAVIACGSMPGRNKA